METPQKSNDFWSDVSEKPKKQKGDVFIRLSEDAERRSNELAEAKKRQKALEQKIAEKYTFKPKINKVPKCLSKNNGKEKDDDGDVFTRLYNKRSYRMNDYFNKRLQNDAESKRI